ncbi:MAG: alpha/beta hydrolase [Motiliproteus sp.]
MSCFDARILINNLPTFESNVPATADVIAYRRFYNIDFTEQGCKQQLGMISGAGFNIATQRFKPAVSQGQALLVHGYHDHHALYGHLIRYLLERNLTVTSFDLPGHGLSSGGRGTIADFDLYQQVLSSVLDTLPDRGQHCHWLGQSTGAAIINQYLLSQKPIIDGNIVLIAPLVRPAQWQLVKLAHNLVKPWVDSLQRKFTDNSHDQAFLCFLKEQDMLQGQTITVEWVSALKRWIPQFLELPGSTDYRPLILQGQQDDTVDWRYNLKVLEQKFPGAQTLLLPQGRHHLANEAVDIRNQYLHWIDQNWL